MAMAASFFMPFINEYIAGQKQVWLQVPVEYLREFLNNDNQAPKVVLEEFYNPESTTLANFLSYIYLIVLGIVLLRFLIGFFHLLFFTIKHGIQKVGPDRLVIMHHLLSVFVSSFNFYQQANPFGGQPWRHAGTRKGTHPSVALARPHPAGASGGSSVV
jgi:hypothetical protein